MKKRIKTLLACPISQHKDYIIREWLQAVQKLDGDFDVFLVDNSPDPNWHKQFISVEVNVSRVDPAQYANNRDYICASRNLILAFLKCYKYDYLFSLECDVFPPQNILPVLLKHQKKITSGFYFTDEKENSFPLIVSFEEYPKAKFTRFFTDTWFQNFIFIDGTLKQAAGAGLGCCLIKKSVFRKIKKFRIDQTDIGHDDSFFFQDCYKHDIGFWVDTSMLCQHKNSSWEIITDHKPFKK